jgi:hypothetical protein
MIIDQVGIHVQCMWSKQGVQKDAQSYQVGHTYASYPAAILTRFNHVFFC